jgi:hypothetical protein
VAAAAQVLPLTATACRHAARGAGGGGYRWRLVGQPPADHLSERVGVDTGQHAAHGRLGGWPEGAGQRVAARPNCAQDRPGRVGDPFADRGQGAGAGQHRGDRHGQHRAQRMLSAASLAWA